MSAKKGLMDFFIKVEDDKEPSKAPQIKEEIKPVPVQAPSSTPFSMPVANEDAEIKKQLSAALDQAKQPGYGYYDMAKAIEAMASIIPSEALRFQSTFAAVSSLGLTSDKLVASAQYYLSVLKAKEDEFVKTVEANTSELITSKENDVTKFDADMCTKSDQIKKLTEEINALQQQKTSIINEVSSNKVKIDQVKNNFNATMRIFVDRINSDIEKIKTYLKPAA